MKVIKIGTKVIINPNTQWEAIKNYVQQNPDTIIVTSGAIALGKDYSDKILKVKQQNSDPTQQNSDPTQQNSDSIQQNSDSTQQNSEPTQQNSDQYQKSIWAAIGQVKLINLYQQLFPKICQVLVTGPDLIDHKPLTKTLIELINLGITPIVNENDVVSKLSPHPNYLLEDNDQLAATLAEFLKADMLIVLTDVNGVYLNLMDPNPIPKLHSDLVNQIKFSSKNISNGGMESKVQSCLQASKAGVPKVHILNGLNPDFIGFTGTEVIYNCPNFNQPMINPTQISKQLTFSDRKQLIQNILANILSQLDKILEANSQDLTRAEHLSTSFKSRLQLTEKKLLNCIQGIQNYLEDSSDPLNCVKYAKQIYLMDLQKITCPLGKILFIFEARPEAILQIVSLIILSGNSVILKGGKEAEFSNRIIISIIQDTITKFGLTENLVEAIYTRVEVQRLLTNSEQIQLVIPRGSKKLVEWTIHSSKIPVLAHSEGICHIYLDLNSKFSDSLKIILDAKLQYSAACNSVETVLIHQDITWISELLKQLEINGVKVHLGPKLHTRFPNFPKQTNFRVEWGNENLTLELVPDLQSAITHINYYSSHHTDVIVSNDKLAIETFLDGVDSSSVFSNASSRFADGRRFGLGAELGISTSKIHARGPVGVEGLVSTKYLIRSTNPQTVGMWE